MPAWPQLALQPWRESQAATEHPVNVAHGEGDVADVALAVRRRKQEQVVHARGAAHEGAATRVAVGGHEAQRL